MGKNIFKVFILGLVLGFGFSGNAFGAWSSYTEDTGSGVTIPDDDGITMNVKLSPNVGLDYDGTDTGYNLATFNQQGTRAYGATENYEGLFVSNGDVDSTDVPAVPAAANAFDSGAWAVVGGGSFPSGL